MIEDDDDDDGVAPRSIDGVLREVPLWRRRLDSWTGRIRGDDQPVTFYFGTAAFGTIYLKPSYPAGMLQCMVMVDKRYVATVHGPLDAVAEIIAGRLDREFGFSAREQHVPDDIAVWAATPLRSGK